MRFTGQPDLGDRLDIPVLLSDERHDPDLREGYVLAIQTLAIVAALARRANLQALPEAKRWALECLLCYGILAIGEARSLVILEAARLNIHARIHFRALNEYDARSHVILNDEAKALQFRDSLAYELRELGKKLGQDETAVETTIAASLGANSRTIKGGMEKSVFGSARDAVPDSGIPRDVRYATAFAYPGHVAHGSIIALKNLAVSIDGRGADFIEAAATDDMSEHMLYTAAWFALHFAESIAAYFDLGFPPQRNTAISAMQAVAPRVGIKHHVEQPPSLVN